LNLQFGSFYYFCSCAVYLLLGMALLAMCFNLMQESVFMKIKRLGRRLGLLRDRSAAAAAS
jgi:hypothetical protein